MDVFQKFLIQDDNELGACIILAKCTFHKQLATPPESNIHGGGQWMFENEGSFSIILYGSSHDYGYPKIDKMKEAIRNDNVYTSKSLALKISARLPDVKYRYQKPNGEFIDL